MPISSDNTIVSFKPKRIQKMSVEQKYNVACQAFQLLSQNDRARIDGQCKDVLKQKIAAGEFDKKFEKYQIGLGRTEDGKIVMLATLLLGEQIQYSNIPLMEFHFAEGALPLNVMPVTGAVH